MIIFKRLKTYIICTDFHTTLIQTLSISFIVLNLKSMRNCTTFVNNLQLLTIPLVIHKTNWSSNSTFSLKNSTKKSIQFQFFTTLFFIHFQLKVNNNKAANNKKLFLFLINFIRIIISKNWNNSPTQAQFQKFLHMYAWMLLDGNFFLSKIFWMLHSLSQFLFAC